MEHPAQQPPVLLVATDGEWAGRSLESVLVANGYAVLRAGLAGYGGIELCRILRDDPGFDAATPIVITAPSPAQHTVRTAAYDAGAWEFCTHPLEADTLVLKLGTFLRAKRSIAEARSQSLIDAHTGVLTQRGMERVAEQLAARAIRNREPLACVVLMPNAERKNRTSGAMYAQGLDDITESILSFLQVSRDAFRRSDIVGRMSDGRLALLAPDTDSDGVQGMLARLRAAIAEAAVSRPDAMPSTEFKAGFWAVPDYGATPIEPAELMRRAARALDHISNPAPGQLSAMSFDQLPVS
jgi:PleD family two-component response regulator